MTEKDPVAAVREALKGVRMGAEKRAAVEAALDAASADLAGREAVADLCASAWAEGYRAASRDASEEARRSMEALAARLNQAAHLARDVDRGRRKAEDRPLYDALDRGASAAQAAVEDAVKAARR